MKTILTYLPYLPDILWFSRLLKSDKVYIERHENFIKSTGRNRCFIAGPAGKLMLSIPLHGGRDHHQLYSSVQISTQHDWQKMHLQGIRSAYGSSPYFEHYIDHLTPYYENKYEVLFDFNSQILNVALKMLKAKKSLIFTESYGPCPEGVLDFRSHGVDTEAVIMPPYYQVFADKTGFIPNLSIIDLIFHLGPEVPEYLLKL